MPLQPKLSVHAFAKCLTTLVTTPSLDNGSIQNNTLGEQEAYIPPCSLVRKGFLMKKSHIGQRSWLLFAFVVCLLLPNRSHADIFGTWLDPLNYWLYVSNMPDIDQRRTSGQGIDGLGNDGNMYCVPTSCMNLLNYAALHGFKQLPPGPYSYQVSPPFILYNFMTNDLAALGTWLGTDPINGTGAAQPGLQAWLESVQPGVFAVSEDWAHDNYSLVISQIAPMVLQGSLANLIIGWYQWNPSFAMYERKGGHEVTLVGAASPSLIGNPEENISIHDPANAEYPDDRLAQSLYHTETYDLKDAVNFSFGWVDGDGDPHPGIRTQQQIVSYDPGYLDGYLAITPKWAFTSTDIHLVAYRPWILADVTTPKFQQYHASVAGKILGLAINPTRVTHPYIVEGSNIVWMLNTLTGKSTRLAAVSNPQQIVLGGRELNLYVLTDKLLLCLDRAGVLHKRTEIPAGMSAIAYDSRNNQIVGISAQTRRLYFFGADDLRMRTNLLLEDVPPGPCRDCLSVNPTDGTVSLHFDGKSDVWQFALNSAGVMTKMRIHLIGGELHHSEGLHVDERGLMYTSVRGKIKVFDSEGHHLSRSRFDGLRAGRHFEIVRPFTNFDPKTMNGPAFYNVLPNRLTH